MEAMQSDNDDTLFVISTSQMRSGTTSLKTALEYLYQGKCYHFDELLHNRSHHKLWLTAARQKKLTKDMANIIFKNYIATCDGPSNVFYRDLLEIYPNAKVVHTVRDPEKWVESVHKTTIRTDIPIGVERLLYQIVGLGKVYDMGTEIYWNFMGRSRQEMRSKSTLKQTYIDYNNEVISTIPKERLLIFNYHDGWEPLCKFLGKPIPDIEYPFLNLPNQFSVTRRRAFAASFLYQLRPFILIMVVVVLACIYLTFICF